MTTQSNGPIRDLVGYGENPPHPQFPGGANVAVNLVVNYEEGSEYSHFLGDGENDSIAEVAYPFPREIRDLATESMYEYGSRVGVWRLLRLFEEFGINATFFACARAFEMNPDVATAARKLGHDLVSHGYRWEEHWRMTREEEAQRIHDAVESFKTTWGSAPNGWYCRYGPSVNTRELVAEHGGFLYDSDAYNDDLPYFTEVNKKRHLVVPYSLTYNDIQGTKAPGDFFEFARRGFDELWLEGERGAPKMMSVGLHPRLIGQAGRTNALREFIEHCQTKGKVWFARRDDIASLWMSQFG
ncbi:polysaccharide deacetylase family protein [Brevibacterium sp. CSND-B09]|uniref:polysaccharide deacetylase family protein n=1 Tax=Brevibacterium sp. CSND-B09 TaxID=3462571 RepID=UPI00406A20DB